MSRALLKQSTVEFSMFLIVGGSKLNNLQPGLKLFSMGGKVALQIMEIFQKLLTSKDQHVSVSNTSVVG